jgi:phospholipase D1/2
MLVRPLQNTNSLLLNSLLDIELIRDAEHYIYIENQFLWVQNPHWTYLTLNSISSTGESPQIQNLIAKALVERILCAAKEGKRFKIVVLLPEVPGTHHPFSAGGILSDCAS